MTIYAEGLDPGSGCTVNSITFSHFPTTQSFTILDTTPVYTTQLSVEPECTQTYIYDLEVKDSSGVLLAPQPNFVTFDSTTFRFTILAD